MNHPNNDSNHSVIIPFDCDRSCPLYERRDLCRFNALFAALGVTGEVNSNTTKLKVTFTDRAVIDLAMKSLGGECLGEGVHTLYGANQSKGIGYKLPAFRYPVVLEADGRFAFDTYLCAASIDRRDPLKAVRDRYAIEAAKKAARAQGWVVNMHRDTLTITHPSGGRMMLKEGSLEAQGFAGKGCHAPTELIKEAIGGGVTVNKPIYYEAKQELNIGSAG